MISSAIGLIFLLFPIHISNYVYTDSVEQYASVNVCIFRYIKLFNINTVKNKPNHMMVNGKDKELDFSHVKANAFGVFKRLQLVKMVQLGDYGLMSDSGAYIALAQSAVSNCLYTVMLYSGSYAKLKNYTILNQSRAGIRYYAKAEIAINALAVINIIIYLISEKVK